VYRERAEPGAVLTRVAASHLRIGTFEYFAARQDHAALERLLDYTLARHYPALATADNRALALLEAVCAALARLVAHWQVLGFVHGVMNTDNMLLCGETVDYGPCAFMENYDPATVFSAIDHQGRYAYLNQPAIAQWNLARFAESLLPLIDADTEAAIERAKAVINGFPAAFSAAEDALMARKLGLPSLDNDDDRGLAGQFLDALQRDAADFTLAFRLLVDEAGPDGARSGAGELLTHGPALLEWLPLWKQRLARSPGDGGERWRRMVAANPVFIPRNHLVQRAISEAEDGDFSFFHRLAERVVRPCAWDPADRELAEPAAPEQRVYRTFCGT
jgi:uncharacterized protein YdiU (UPF0061 family)